MHVIAIVSTKGGVGKTAAAASLAGAIAVEGVAVLAVDVDPRGGLSSARGARSHRPGLYEVRFAVTPWERRSSVAQWQHSTCFLPNPIWQLLTWS